MRTAGHVFIAHADLLRLECDAWLLPCDSGGSVARYWRVAPNHDVFSVWQWPGEDWSRVRRSVALEGENDRPRPFLTDVAGGRRAAAAWFAESARAFVAAASERLEGTAPRNKRARHLLAMPIVGTGYGGGAERAAQIVAALLPMLHEEVGERGLDIVLVAKDAAHYAAAQAERTSFWARSGAEAGSEAGRGPWSALGEGHLARARELARAAEERHLVLFLGAGISRGAGLVDWGELLDRLAEQAGLGAAERVDLARLDYLDRAQILEKRLGGAQQLAHRVAESLACPRHSLAHALLAGLPVQEVVTTNYDALFELAVDGTEERIEVLMPGRRAASRRWLLKMHGCVSDPRSIVLTRTDYLRYAEGRGALMGIVQALLMTRHMLFIGFSLDDPNFHRIADAVRRAVDPSAPATPDLFGTALSIGNRTLVRELWSSDLEWIAFDGGDAPGPAGHPHPGEAARQHDIFLDCLSAHARRADHLFHHRFRPLEGGESELAAALDGIGALVSRLRAEGSDSPALPAVERMLVEVGARRRRG